MSDIEKQIELKLYGLPQDRGQDVRADVFVKKIQQLLRGLRAADKQKNGQKTLEYLISDLKHSSAYASMREFQSNIERVPQHSAIETLHSVALSVKNGQGIPSETHPSVAKTIAEIGNDTEKQFSHGELGVDGVSDSIVRIDKIFNRQADRAFKEYRSGKDAKLLYEGVAFGTFKGTLKVIDLRGTVTSAKLILSIGGIELDCTANSITVENLKDALDQDVMVSGLAHYNGTEKLPEHVEIKKIDILDAGSDSLKKWAGAFSIPPLGEDW